MATKHKPRTAAYPVPWAEHATVFDAYYFAQREHIEQLAKFKMAIIGRDNEGTIAAVKQLRGVADKLDAFRRMKVREWTAAQAANQNTEGVES